MLEHTKDRPSPLERDGLNVTAEQHIPSHDMTEGLERALLSALLWAGAAPARHFLGEITDDDIQNHGLQMIIRALRDVLEDSAVPEWPQGSTAAPLAVLDRLMSDHTKFAPQWRVWDRVLTDAATNAESPAMLVWLVPRVKAAAAQRRLEAQVAKVARSLRYAPETARDSFVELWQTARDDLPYLNETDRGEAA